MAASSDKYVDLLDQLELVESMNEFNTMAAEFDVMVDALDEELSTPLLADSMEDVDKAIATFDEVRQPLLSPHVRTLPDLSLPCAPSPACLGDARGNERHH